VCQSEQRGSEIVLKFLLTTQRQTAQHKFAQLAAIVGLVLTAAPAFAQTAEMGLPSIAKDRGLRSGDFLLKPSVTVTGHYDTNLFNASPTEKNLTPLVGGLSIRIAPRLSLQNDLTGNTVFNFAAAGDGRIYASSDPLLKNLNNFGGTANLDVTFGQRKPIAFTLFDFFNRSLRANNWETIQTLNRNANDVGARVEFHPGDTPERRPFNLALSGSYAIDRFQDYGGFDTNTIHTRLMGSWRFLPKTAAYMDATWDFRSFTDQSLLSRNLAYNSKPFRVRLGTAGAITKRISYDLSAGWGMALLSSATVAGFNSYLAGASFGFRPTETTRITVGYSHDMRDAYIGGFADMHRFGTGIKQRLGSLVDISISFAASYLKYGAAQASSGVSVVGANQVLNSAGQPIPGFFQRHDWQLDGNATVSFEVSRYVGIGAGYNLRSVITPFKLTSASTTGLLDAGEYTAHEIFASVTARY
jgi:hypothetical protein